MNPAKPMFSYCPKCGAVMPSKRVDGEHRAAVICERCKPQELDILRETKGQIETYVKKNLESVGFSRDILKFTPHLPELFLPYVPRADTSIGAQDGQKWLILYGPPGVGKTGMMFSLAAEWFQRRADQEGCPEFKTCPWKFENSIGLEALVESLSQEGLSLLRDQLGSVPFLIIDDLDVLGGTVFRREILRIIYLRYAEERPTFITTNLDPHELQERLDARAFSRLLGKGDAICMEGPDRRLGKDSDAV